MLKPAGRTINDAKNQAIDVQNLLKISREGIDPLNQEYLRLKKKFLHWLITDEDVTNGRFEQIANRSYLLLYNAYASEQLTEFMTAYHGYPRKHLYKEGYEQVKLIYENKYKKHSKMRQRERQIRRKFDRNPP